MSKNNLYKNKFYIGSQTGTNPLVLALRAQDDSTAHVNLKVNDADKPPFDVTPGVPYELQISKSTKWKTPLAPSVPLSAGQCFAVDISGNVLLIHRSKNVRSARDVWSLPSGMHEIGETLQETVIRELAEEFELDVLDGVAPRCIGIYENIAGDDPAEQQFHWVMCLYGVLVENCFDAVNSEPDKHDEFAIIQLSEMLDASFTTQYRFHPSLHNWFHTDRNIHHAYAQLRALTNVNR